MTCRLAADCNCRTSLCTAPECTSGDRCLATDLNLRAACCFPGGVSPLTRLETKDRTVYIHMSSVHLTAGMMLKCGIACYPREVRALFGTSCVGWQLSKPLAPKVMRAVISTGLHHTRQLLPSSLSVLTIFCPSTAVTPDQFRVVRKST